MKERQRHPALEPLETRAAPVGFIQGPPAEPKQLFLNGTVEARAQDSTRGQVEILRIAGSGRLSSIGRATVNGRLKVEGDTEQGAFILDSPSSRLTLDVSGSSQPGNVFRFHIVHGMGVLPNTTAQFVREDGVGTLTITLGSGTGRVPVTLMFQSFHVG